MSLTEDELDEVCDTLRRKYGAGIFSAAGVCRKEQVRRATYYVPRPTYDGK